MSVTNFERYSPLNFTHHRRLTCVTEHDQTPSDTTKNRPDSIKLNQKRTDGTHHDQTRPDTTRHDHTARHNQTRPTTPTHIETQIDTTRETTRHYQTHPDTVMRG